jgi:hypothetical protein
MAGSHRGILLAGSVAVLLHLLLFSAVRPSIRSGLAGTLVPPETHYLARATEPHPATGSNIRTLWSPVLFSLPSEMGFSRELLHENLRTRLTFTQQVEPESFLDVAAVSRGMEVRINPQELMLTAEASRLPVLPQDVDRTPLKRPASRRVYVAPELKERLVGGIVLPPELNREVESAWQVRAAVSISEQGAVRHVFLDQPLESAELNQQVLQLLYGLRFRSGSRPVEGGIEIYSPETMADGGADQ